MQQHIAGTLVLQMTNARADLHFEAMPVEQISGLPVAARLVSRAWLVKSAEATLKPSSPSG